MEIRQLDQFRKLLREASGVFVITDVARPPIAHNAACAWLNHNNFVTKVVEGNNRTGRYYWFASLEQARLKMRVRRCQQCHAQDATTR